MGYSGGTNQVPAPQPQAPVSLFRSEMESPSTSISQNGTVKIESFSRSASSEQSSVTTPPTDNGQNSSASECGVDAEERDRDVAELLLFLSKQGPIINALMKK